MYNLKAMESMESLEQPEKTKEQIEWQEQRYQETAEAVNALYAMSLENDTDDDRIDGRYFEMSLGVLQDRMTEGDRIIFFDTLKLIDQIIEIEKNYELRDEFFHNEDIKYLVSTAKYAFFWGLERVDKKFLEEMNKEDAKLFLKSLEGLFSIDADYVLEKAVKFIREHKETFGALGDKLGVQEISERFASLENFLDSPTFEGNLAHAIQTCMHLRKTNKIQYGEPLLREIIEKYGLDYEKMHDAWWSHQHSSGFPEPSIFKNIVHIHEIEAKKMGAARLLFKEYGIRNFERYPTRLLVAQAEAHKDDTKPYGIILNPENDWNGAFSNDYQTWGHLHLQLEECGYALRVIECESKQEIARRLISLDRWYGKNHKISFAFVGGHGTEDTIRFGGLKERNTLFTEDFAGRGVRKTNKFFEPKPTIILVSCSTGAEKGIGQKLSETLGAKVIAPKVPTNLRHADVSLNERELVFKVTYGKGWGVTERIDEKGVYVGGKPVGE